MSIPAVELISIARRYWRPDKHFDFRPENSPEAERFLALWEQELEKMDHWRSFLRELREALPDFNVGNVTATCDACLRCSVYPKTGNAQRPRRWAVLGCVSILAPIYTIYGIQYEYSEPARGRPTETVLFEPLPPEMRGPAGLIARGVEAKYGVGVLPREVAETPVPLIVESREPPDTTLFHAFFTSRPERIP